MSTNIEEIVYNVLSRILTPEEIKRLKQYASDEYYNLYILAKSEIENTIRRAKEALSIANNAIAKATEASDIANTAYSKATDALNISRNASNLADRANNIANTAYSYAQGALTQARQALSKAEEALSTANTAYSKASDAFNLADTAKAWADDALTKANNALRQLEDAWKYINDITKYLNDLVDSMNRAKDQLVDLYNTKKRNIDTYNSKILESVNKIGAPNREGTILYNVAITIQRILDTIGYARVDFSRLDGERTYGVAGNTGQGLARNLAEIMWDLGQAGYHLSRLIEKFHLGFELLGTEFGWDFYVPRPDRLASCISWIFRLPQPTKSMLEKFDELGDRFNYLWGLIGNLMAEINNILMYTQLILGEITGFFVEAIQIITNAIPGTKTVTIEPTTLVTSTQLSIPQGAKPTSTANIATPSVPSIPDVGQIYMKISDDGRVQELKKQVGTRVVTKKTRTFFETPL